MMWKKLPLESASSRYFISYRSLNRPLAEQLAARLAEAGQAVWRDRDNIYVGDDWASEIRLAIADCDDVIVLLTKEVVETPDTPESRNQVLYEIRTAVDLDKRILCFSTVDVRAYGNFYALLEDRNFMQLPDDLCQAVDSDQQRVAWYIAGQILRPVVPEHPVNMRDFERIAVRRIFPAFEDICQRGVVKTGLLSGYLSYAEHLVGNTRRVNSLLLLNSALVAAHMKEWKRAFGWFDKALSLKKDPLTMYYFACALMKQERPWHMQGARLDRCIALLQDAWKSYQSPLIAIAMVAVLWDGGKGRGPKAQKLFIDALGGLSLACEDEGEVSRLLWFLPRSSTLELPVDTAELFNYLKNWKE